MKSDELLPEQESASTRRVFLKSVTAAIGWISFDALALPALSGASAKSGKISVFDLPNGAASTPLSFSHFPDGVHAFVWRNWPLVPVERMARVIGAKTSDLERMGRAMGLGRPPRISRDQQARSYLTVIKRNWHLLPYDQLLELLGWTAERLDYTLREDDFLFIKLGNLKPRCERLRYTAPDTAVLRREEEIARVVREEFPGGVCDGTDPLFGFVSELSRKPVARAHGTRSQGLKFCYSYFALYGDPLLEQEADPYPEGYLARLADAGVNGVWLQAVLYKLAPFPWEPERSQDYQTRLANLRKLIARAARHGIKVFLYLNEPRAMPLRFYETRPELKGVSEGDYAAFCTSAPEVRRFLVDSVAAVCRAAPDLGGFFTITASENLTNCWSHGGGANCPRCARRSPAEVIAEVNSLFYEGIRTAGTSAQLIAWDWGWDDGWGREAIRRLPEGVALMSVSEWRLPIERGGIKTEVGEYSISAVGPGPRAEKNWQAARERGLKILAKVQAGNTWELSAVPYIPAVKNVARHAENLRRAGVKDLMLGWTLGGYPSSNLEVACEALESGSADEAMEQVAKRKFGPALAPAMVAAWRGFSAAFSEFPYHGGVVYSGPQQLGPANLLWGEATGYKATMVGFPYDDLDGWRAVYPPEIFVQQLEKVADGFDRCLDELHRVSARTQGPSSAAQRNAFAQECGVAEAATIHFRSTANQARFVLARRSAAAAKTRADRAAHLAIIRHVLRDEISLAKRLHRIQCHDSRIGFEASNHYFYVPADLAEKVLNCHHLLSWSQFQG